MRRRVDIEHGFSLVEVLIVLALLGAAAVLVWPRGGGQARALELDAAAETLAARLAEARTRAIARAVPVHVDFDTGARRYAISGDTRPVHLPPDLALTLTMARSELTASGNARLTFMPDGSATGGTIRLVRGTRRIDIAVSWLTGGVALVRQP